MKTFYPLAIATSGILLTLLFSNTLYRGVEREKASTFAAQANWATMLLRSRIEHYEGALIDARSHIISGREDKIRSFIHYVKGMGLYKRYPGLQGLGLALAVQRKNISSTEASARRTHPEFKIWPDNSHDTVYPIVALEPFNEMNQRALGFDMGSEERRRKAIEASAKTKAAVLSGKIVLVQEDQSTKPGFNLYLPVFIGDETTPYGFVYSPFRSENVFGEVLKKASPHITVEIFDSEKPEAESLLYRSPDLHHGSYEASEVVTFGGRKLLLRFRDHPSLKAGYSYGSVWMTCALGIFTTLALVFLFQSSQRQMRLVQSQLQVASNLRLRDEIIDRSLNGFDIVDQEGKLIYVNPAYVKMWGYDNAAEIIGTSPAGHCADPAVPLKIIDDLKTKGHCDIEFTALRKDGSTFEVRMLSFLAHDNDGREIYPSTSIDISQHKNALRTRDEFLSLASHELKTPLTTLVLQVQTFEKLLKINPELAHEPSRHEKFVAMTRSQVQRLTRLVDDMLDISRISTGRLSLRREHFDLRDLVKEIVERMAPQFETSKVDVPVVPEGKSLTGNWDKLRIDQAIVNLLTNALKYGEKKTVTIELGEHKDGVFISISDKGPGISTEAQARVFNRYERAVNSTEISGLGLGLFLTRQIVEGHGGKIHLESSPGAGSRFTIILPPDDGQAGDIPIA